MWGFSFNLDSPDVWHEEVGAIIRAKKADVGGHYSTSHMRYDWLTMNHFADMSGTGSVGVTLSNIDCQYMKLANSSPTNFVTTIPQIYVLAGGQVDGATFGILNQGGDNSFLQRFALQTHSAYDPASAMRFSLEHQNPFVAGTVTGGSQYPEKTFALLNTSNQNILLWALKPAEDGISQGLITRWWNMASGNQNLAFSLPGAPITSAQKASHVETPQGAATVSSGTLQQSFAAQQMSTFLLKVSSPPPSGDTSPTNAAPTQNFYRTGSPTLTWARLSWAVGYEVQLSRTKTFTTPINSGVIAANQTAYTVSPALDEGTWYWRVHGLKSLSPLSAGTWSAPQSFVIDLP
jgi:alpha-mannosidase